MRRGAMQRHECLSWCVMVSRWDLCQGIGRGMTVVRDCVKVVGTGLLGMCYGSSLSGLGVWTPGP